MSDTNIDRCAGLSRPHSLIRILETGPDIERTVVRWCYVCGAVVIDVDVDGRTAPGRVMRMKIPHISTL